MRRRFGKAFATLLVLFLALLPLYYTFSADKPDGLEQTLAQGGGPPEEVLWRAPLSYGSTIPESFLQGVLGVAVVMAVFLMPLIARRALRAGRRGGA